MITRLGERLAQLSDGAAVAVPTVKLSR